MTSALVSNEDRQRLARLLGMMDSIHDGEALNAARPACRMMKKLKLQWPELLTEQSDSYTRGFGDGCAYAQAQGYRHARPQQYGGWSREAEYILGNYGHLLSEWEESFLTSIFTRRYPLTPRQQDVMDRLRQKYG